MTDQNTVEALERLMAQKADLHPDLVDSIHEGALGPMVHHPLVITPFYIEGWAALVNAQYDEAAKLVGAVWTDSENIYQNQADWISMLEDVRDNPNLMEEEDRTALADMPDTLTIYRGHNGGNRDGLSWTLEEKRAHWFASRFAEHRGEPYVIKGEIAKADVIAYFGGRNEQEVVAFPADIQNKVEAKLV